MKYLFLTVSALLLSACTASGTRFSGESATYGGDNILRNDVLAYIRQIESAAHGCTHIGEVSAKVDYATHHNGRPLIRETWTVSACGQRHNYPVIMHEDERGETDFSVTFQTK